MSTLSWSGAGLGLVLNLVLGGLAWWRGSVSGSGFIVGVLVGTTIFVAGGAGAFAALVAFFLLGSAATHLGYRRKVAGGLAQEEGGRRGSRHALANCSTGALCALILPLWPSTAVAVALVSAFATATSDTLGSEIGQLYGRRPFLLTTFRRVPAGTEGAVSVEGTVAGIAGSALLGWVGAVFDLYPQRWIAGVVIAAFVGTTFESYVGALWGRDARIGNETMNFLNTVVGAATGLLLVLLAQHWGWA